MKYLSIILLFAFSVSHSQANVKIEGCLIDKTPAGGNLLKFRIIVHNNLTETISIPDSNTVLIDKGRYGFNDVGYVFEDSNSTVHCEYLVDGPLYNSPQEVQPGQMKSIGVTCPTSCFSKSEANKVRFYIQILVFTPSGTERMEIASELYSFRL